jgi:thioredoxin 1
VDDEGRASRTISRFGETGRWFEPLALAAHGTLGYSEENTRETAALAPGHPTLEEYSMLLISLATLALCSPCAVALPSAPPPIVSEDHGKLPWFEGTYEDALQEAKSKNKLVFIDLWTTWCGWCKRLDKDTYSDDSVAAEMKDIVCFNIDAESKAGVPLAKKFNVRGYPALILLSPDGSYRDQIGGYLKPEEFKREIQRVRSGKGTVAELRAQVEADKSNVDKRYTLANKLKEIDDKPGIEEQISEIKRLDPDGKSLPMHQLAFDQVVAGINAGWQASQTLDMASMQKFIDRETYPDVLFQAWNSMVGMQSYLAQKAQQENHPDEVKKIQADVRQSLEKAWKNCPKKYVASFGKHLASAYYVDREQLTPAEKGLALEVARQAQAAEPEDASVLDALACALFMNGQKEEAMKFNARCITLEPKSTDWQSRQAEFAAAK